MTGSCLLAGIFAVYIENKSHTHLRSMGKKPVLVTPKNPVWDVAQCLGPSGHGQPLNLQLLLMFSSALLLAVLAAAELQGR